MCSFLKKKYANLFLLLSSIIFTLFIVEIFLQLNADNEYYIWYPNQKQYLLPDSSIFPGIEDTSLLIINSLGFRADEYENENKIINIVTIGGSTTECLYLDQKETWPALLEKYLNIGSRIKFRVYNGGRSGLTSQHNLIQIQMLLNIYDWMDIIIVLNGINDLQSFLSSGDNYKYKNEPTVIEEAFQLSPLNSNLPFNQKSYLIDRIKKLRNLFLNYKLYQDPYGNMYKRWRENRKSSSKINKMPASLEGVLSDFKKNDELIIKEIKNKQKAVLFLTQPVLWKEDMPKSLEDLCWFGWIGKNQNENTGQYYTMSVLKDLMDQYNSELLNLCQKEKIDIINLGKTLEKDTTTFYDDCHFNEKGARKIAKIISSYMQNKFKWN